MLKLGEKSINKLFFGDKAISKAYLGNKLVFIKKYTELEYLETKDQQNNNTTTDASWINTGVIPTITMSMECRMQFTTIIDSSSGTEALNGATGGSGRFAWGFANLSPRKNFYFGLGSQNLNTTLERDTDIHTFKINAVNKTWAIDDISGNFSSSLEITATNSIFLFARNNGSVSANKPANAKIYYCKIWDNNILIRDLIPVLDANNVPCMFDKVTDQFFYNQGTKQFTYKLKV